jgi:hypothetical protein
LDILCDNTAFECISELITDVDDYIEFYNHRRFHETLAYKKPMDVYQESIKLNQEKAKAEIGGKPILWHIMRDLCITQPKNQQSDKTTPI